MVDTWQILSIYYPNENNIWICLEIKTKQLRRMAKDNFHKIDPYNFRIINVTI